MNKLSKEKKDQLIALCVGVGVGIIVIWYLLIKPWGAQITQAKADTDAKIAQLEAAQKLVGTAATYKADLEKAKETLGAIEAGMSGANPYLEMNTAIGDFGKKFGDVEISSVGNQQFVDVQVIPKFPYKAVRFNVSGNGFYHEIGKFIAEFENQFPYMRIQNINLEPSRALETVAGETNAAEKLSFDFQIVSLMKPEPKEAK